MPLLEMIIIRLADNLTTYMVDVIGECIKAQPGILKSSKDQMSAEVGYLKGVLRGYARRKAIKYPTDMI